MPQPRATFAVATDQAGAIYAFGGFDNGHPVDEIDKFTPSTGQWTAVGLAPHAFLPLTGATGPDGLIYLVAAAAAAALTHQPPERLVAYDPATGRWSDLGPLPAPRLGAAVAISGNTLYVIGGAHPNSKSLAGLTIVMIYSIHTRRWGTAAPIPTPLVFPAATVDHHGRIYLIGGGDTSGATSAQVSIYDPTLNSWTTGPPLLQPVGGLGAATGKDGRIYAIGGATTSGQRRVVNTAELLSPSP
jgi:N-acetylneuraminic acid mutarotase